jgi:hypothetical protein
MKYPPPTIGKFRTVTKLTVRKFRTLLLVNQGRVVWGWSWAGLVLSGWLEARARNATRRKVRSAAAYSFIVLPLFARLEALNRRIATPPQCQIDPLRDDVVDFYPLLEGDLP